MITVTVPILYQDPQMIVCVKPAGLLSERGGLPELLEAQCGGVIFPVHRLDRAVGGVMVYARSREAAARLSAQIAGREIEKDYFAVVQGRPEADSGCMTDLLYHDREKNKSYVVDRERKGVRSASLRYRLLACAETAQGPLSLVRIRLETGRSHQIRVQFASRKLPLVGDRRYGSTVGAGEIALWSAALRIPGAEGGPRSFFAPPPDAWPWDLFDLPCE